MAGDAVTMSTDYAPGDRVHVTSDAVTRAGVVVDTGRQVPGWVQVLPDGWTVARYWPADRVAHEDEPAPTLVALAHELAGEDEWRDRRAVDRLRYVRWLATLEPVPFMPDHADGWVATWDGGDGYSYRARLTDEPYPVEYGTWSDEWAPGAVENPRYRHARDVYLWWLPESPALEEDRAAFTAAGYSRHAAWLACERLNRGSVPAYDEPGPYRLEVTCSRAGVDLADEMLGSVQPGDVWHPDRDPYVWDQVHELAGEVRGMAADKLAALVAGAR